MTTKEAVLVSMASVNCMVAASLTGMSRATA